MQTTNPLLAVWRAPFGMPPFAEIQAEHFKPALNHAMQLHLAELRALGAQTEKPTFENTVAAFDCCGGLLSAIEAVFSNLTASETSAALQEVQREMAVPLSAHYSAVYMDAALFARIDTLHTQRTTLSLDAEALRMLERVHLDFVRSGARLPQAQQQRYAAVMEQLATLTTRFAQNVLHDETEHVLPLHGEADLAGLPPDLRAAAQQAARDRGHAASHVVTLARSSVVPFLTFSARRDLREQAWRAWTQRGEHAGEHDNRDIARQILALRNEQARLHGHASFADHALTDTMAGQRSAVQKLLGDVWPRALQAVAREEAALKQEMQKAGEQTELAAWDWRYWAERVRSQKYALDDAQVKPYFQLERMVQAAFDCAEKLFGLRFVPRADVPVYHVDVKAYEVLDRAGATVGLFLQDNFARSSKRSGAWMSALRWQRRNGGVALPVILNNNNFAKGAPGQPSLLSMDDAQTLFHEFGHGLHGLLSNVNFERLSGTQVLRDFVELPSQIFEHWLSEEVVLRQHARHWQTNEAIPQALVAKLMAAKRFNQGYETVRYCASAMADMAAHALGENEQPNDVCAFEHATLKCAGLPDAVGTNHRLVHFQHLFAGSGYAAGYYVYMWAEVLDADGFEAFKEAGDPFDPAVAARLKRYVYASGNSLEPGAAYVAFRGRAANVEPMLRERGLLATT